jgi:hypothetical protein
MILSYDANLGRMEFSERTGVRFGSKADIPQCNCHVRFTPKSRHQLTSLECPLRPIADITLYSITSSARESTASGIVRPSAFAVLRLMTNSNLTGCVMGRSAGLAPLRTRPV